MLEMYGDQQSSDVLLELLSSFVIAPGTFTADFWANDGMISEKKSKVVANPKIA